MENSKPSKLDSRSTISESIWCQSSIVQFNLIWTLTSFYALQTALVPLFKTICPIPNLEHELISPEPFLLTFWIHWPSIKIGRCVPPNFSPTTQTLIQCYQLFKTILRFFNHSKSQPSNIRLRKSNILPFD